MSDRQVRELLELPEPFYVTDARKVMEDYYEEPVYPVSEVCAKIDLWIGAMERLQAETHRVDPHDNSFHGSSFVYLLSNVRLAIRKSSLLARLLYEREKFRTRPCPAHNGSWSGVEFFGAPECPHGCNLTGWLPEP